MPVRQPYAGVDFIPQSRIFEFGYCILLDSYVLKWRHNRYTPPRFFYMSYNIYSHLLTRRCQLKLLSSCGTWPGSPECLFDWQLMGGILWLNPPIKWWIKFSPFRLYCGGLWAYPHFISTTAFMASSGPAQHRWRIWRHPDWDLRIDSEIYKQPTDFHYHPFQRDRKTKR